MSPHGAPSRHPADEPRRDRRPRLVADNAGLVATSLGKSFKKRPVLRDVSSRCSAARWSACSGPNGAGKTTSFYMIVGLIAADAGRSSSTATTSPTCRCTAARGWASATCRRRPSIFRGLTVEQNILAILEVVEPDARPARGDARRAAGRVLASPICAAPPAIALSGGERRRVEIARALAIQPHFILLDEPLAGIDPIAVSDIRELVSHLKDRGIGVLITDHNVRETLEIIDRAYIVHDGQVLMEGAPAEIVAR